MEGRDPQRSGRSATVGVDQPRLLWSVPVDPPSFSQPIFASDGSIYLGSVSGTLPAVGADGRRLWTFSAPGPLPSPAIGPDGGVYVRAGDGALHALHPDGRRRWTTEIGAQPLRLGPAPVVGPDRYVYLASYHSTLVYLVQPGGFIQWAYNVHARLPGAVALAPDGTIYLGAADGKVRAMDREMVQRWIFDAGAPIASAPALGPDGTLYVLVGEQPRALLALDASGAKRWSVEACWSPGAQALWPSVAADGRAQVANCSVRPDGTTAWRAAGAGSSATPAALDADGNAYFASGSTLYSVRPDGTPRWSYQAEGEVGPPSLGTFGTIAFTTSGPDRLHLLGR